MDISGNNRCLVLMDYGNSNFINVLIKYHIIVSESFQYKWINAWGNEMNALTIPIINIIQKFILLLTKGTY